MYQNTTFKLVPLIPNSKKPLHPKYNEPNYNPVINTNQVAIAHLPSGTCSLDVDDYAQSSLFFKAQFNVDLKSLIESNPYIYNGNPNKYKIIYKLSTPLRSKQTNKNDKVLFELTCMTKKGLTALDTIPPSMHPDTKLKYQWIGDFHQIQEMPIWLVEYWKSLLVVKEIKQPQVFNATYDEIWEALSYIDANCIRKDWLNIAMAINHADTILGENRGYLIFDKWSQGSVGKYDQDDVKTTYDSIKFDPDGVTVATLFDLAAQKGWHKRQADVSGMFPVVNTTLTKPLKNPTDIMQALRPAPPNLNLELLPPIIRELSEQISENTACDPLVTAFACLSAACGVIDSRNELYVNSNFRIKSILWVMMIGDSGTTKSPGSRPVFQVLKKIVAESRIKREAEKIMYEGEAARYNKQKKDWIKYIENPLNTPNPSTDPASVPPENIKPPPKPLRIIVQDITSQSLVIRCDDNPRGVLCYLDEMSSWAKKMCDTSSTEDRGTWTVSFEGASYERDRVSTGVTYAENVAVSVYGNIQPRVIEKYIHKLSEDGMMQRFMPCVIRDKYDSVKPNLTKDITIIMQQWELHMRTLFKLGEQNEHPYHTYTLSPDAFRTFDTFNSWVIESKKEMKRSYQDGGIFAEAISKSPGTVCRLALVFHLIETVGETSISNNIMQRAITMVKDYVLPSCRYAYGEIGRTSGYMFSIWITNYILQQTKPVVLSIRDIKRGGGNKKFDQMQINDNYKKDVMIRDEMSVLESYGWVIAADTKNTKWQVREELTKQFHSHRNAIIQIRENLLKKFSVPQSQI